MRRDTRLFQANGFLVGGCLFKDGDQTMGALVPHLDRRLLGRLDNAECTEEFVQLRRVIEITRILHQEFPIGADRVALVSGDSNRALHDSLEPGNNGRAQIVIERFGVVSQAAEHNPGDRVDGEATKSVLALVEVRSKSADPAATSFKGDTGQASLLIAGPVVIDAGQMAGITAWDADHFGATMRAAIDQRTEYTGVIANENIGR